MDRPTNPSLCHWHLAGSSLKKRVHNCGVNDSDGLGNGFARTGGRQCLKTCPPSLQDVSHGMIQLFGEVKRCKSMVE